MKHPYFKTILLCLCMFASINAFAEAVEIDGIYYNLVTKIKQAEVTKNPNKYTGTVNIPETVTYNSVTYSVTSIGDKAFYDCYRLTSVAIPNSVTNIGSAAFYNCSHLASLSIPNSVTAIGSHAFTYCSSLLSITIPNYVTCIRKSTFYGCYRLTSVTIGNSVESIENSAFFDCQLMTSITIPSSLRNIGYEAFARCFGLNSVHITDLATWCRISFEYNNDRITDYYYSSNPLFYAQHLYLNGQEIKDLIIPNSVTCIESGSFSGCSSVTSVVIPNSVKYIRSDAFLDCTNLTAVHITDLAKWCNISFASNTSNPLYYAKKLYLNGVEIKDLIIPNNVKEILLRTFKCLDLTSVTIPNSVTSIGNEAFDGCSGLTSVNIGNGVKSIGNYAFRNCAELTDVYCYAENVPSTQSYAFDGSYIEYATLHVPAASVEQYKATAPWSNFGTIVATDGTIPEPPTPEKCAAPTISYSKGKLTFKSETEDAICLSTITNKDITSYSSNEVQLQVTYNISVYATKAGYENSDTIQATLCWIEQQPQTEGITDEDAIAEVQAVPVLIQTQGNTITVEGAEAGTEIILYGANGVQLDSVIATTGIASLNTSRLSGSVAIVKIGNKTVKVLVKQ